jgi:hypothetical protein
VVNQMKSIGQAGHGALVVTGGVGVQQVFLDSVVGEVGKLGVDFDWVEKVVDVAAVAATALSRR